ncbi:MAG TPA: alpha-galactosidase, partial [bacterium]|nr:alpha-galactosidase [bacterium]
MPTGFCLLLGFALWGTGCDKKPLPELVSRAALAPTPPMGWNSWNKFQCAVSDSLIRQTADAMVANGMRDAGYLYV